MTNKPRSFNDMALGDQILYAIDELGVADMDDLEDFFVQKRRAVDQAALQRKINTLISTDAIEHGLHPRKGQSSKYGYRRRAPQPAHA